MFTNEYIYTHVHDYRYICARTHTYVYKNFGHLDFTFCIFSFTGLHAIFVNPYLAGIESNESCHHRCRARPVCTSLQSDHALLTVLISILLK